MRKTIQTSVINALRNAIPGANKHRKYKSYGEMCYFKSSAMQYEDEDVWQHHLNQINKAEKVSVDSVELSGLSFGSNQSQVKQYFGKPKYAYKLSKTRSHTIYYYYSNKPETGSFTTELHFYNDYLFMIKQLVEDGCASRFNWLNLIRKKFQVDSLDSKTVLADPYGRVLHVIDTVVTEIRFIDSAFLEAYTEFILNEKSNRVEAKTAHLITEWAQLA
jgi:hypothetical protein